MYAVIRAGGKQYRVAPGDVIRVETTPAENGTVEFSDILAVSGEPGKIGRPEGDVRVVGNVVESGRGDKVLVFHYKRKKQYKKLQGHRQAYTAVRITEIAFDGQRFTAPELPQREKTTKQKSRPAREEGSPAAEVEQPTVKASGGKSGSRATAETARSGSTSARGASSGKKSTGKKAGTAKSAAKKGSKKK